MPPTLSELLADINAKLASAGVGQATDEQVAAALKNVRGGSRFATADAGDDTLRALAAGGSVEDLDASRLTVHEPPRLPGARGATAGADGRRDGDLSPAQRLVLGITTRAMSEATGGAGGFAVERDLAVELLRLLRAKSVVMRAGARAIPVRKELAINSVSTGTSAAWAAEGALIPYSEMVLAQATLLRPRNLASLTALSNKIARDSAAVSQDVAEAIVSDIAQVMALKFDLAALQGTGSANEPLGIKATSGLTAAPAGPPNTANGGIPDLDYWRKALAQLWSANIPLDDDATPVWFFNSRTLDSISRLKDANGHFLAEEASLLKWTGPGTGSFLAVPFFVTNQIPSNVTKGTSGDTSYALLGDAREIWVAENTDGVRFERSGEASYSTDGGTTWISSFQSDQQLIRGIHCCDVAVRRPASFVYLDGLRPVA